jgi:membrane-bound lytic murein transglycosylase B
MSHLGQITQQTYILSTLTDYAVNHSREKLFRPELRAALVYESKHKHLEGNLATRFLVNKQW